KNETHALRRADGARARPEQSRRARPEQSQRVHPERSRRAATAGRWPRTQYNSSVMSILKVARMGHPVLRGKARAIERADITNPAVQKLIDDMIETMLEYHGVGLAA